MKEYTVLIHGMPHTVLLPPEEAERRGAVEVDRSAAAPDTKQAAPANKARGAENK